MPADFKLMLKNSETLVITTIGEGKEISAEMPVAVLDELLIELAKFRMGMKPPIAPELADGASGIGAINPRWALVSHQSIPDRSIALRHDGFGWLLFTFPPTEATALSNALRSESNILLGHSQSSH